MLQEAGDINNTVVLIFRHIQCFHLMLSEVAWVLVSSETQVRLQIILDPDYLSARKFYIRRNNNKIDSIERGRIVITHLFP